MIKKWKFLPFILGVGLLVSACSSSIPFDPNNGGEGTDIDTPWVEYSVPATSVTFAEGENNLTINKGETHTYDCVVEPRKANMSGLSWSSGNDNVATIDKGVLTAVNGGSTTITVSSSAGTFNPIPLNVTVVVPLENFNVSEEEINLGYNDTFELNTLVSYVPEDTTQRGVSFTVNNDNIESVVSETGSVLTGNVDEDFTVSISSAFINKNVDVTVHVSEIHASSISINNKEVNKVEINKSLPLSATVLPEDCYDKGIIWSVDDTSLATISEEGVLSAKDAAGSVVVTATSKENPTLSDSLTVEIYQVFADSMSAQADEITVSNKNTSYKLELTYFANDEEVTPSKTDVSYEVISGSEAVSVNYAGNVRFIAPGNAVIRITDNMLDNTIKYIDVTVHAILQAESVTITGPTLVESDSEIVLEVSTNPELSLLANSEVTAEASSGRENISISVSGNRITVRGLKAGSSAIVAYVDGVASLPHSVTVKAQEGYGLKVNNTKVKANYVGSEVISDVEYQQYKISRYEFHANDKVTLYDFANVAEWIVPVDPYSFNSNPDAYILTTTGYWKILQDFTGDVYIKLAYGADNVYFAIHDSSTDPVVASEYKAVIGDNEFILDEQDISTATDGIFGKFSIDHVSVTAGESIKFYADGVEISSYSWGGDNNEPGSLAYNNYVETVDGYKIQASSSDTLVELKLYDVYVAWISGGNSAVHTDGSIPSEGYGLLINGSNKIAATHSEELGPQGEDQYYLLNYTFAVGDTIKLYNYSSHASWIVNIDEASFGGNTSGYISTEDGTWVVTRGFVADVYIKIQYENDSVYFGLISADPLPVTYTAVIGENTYTLTSQDINPATDGSDCVGKYSYSGASLTEGELIKFYADETELTSIYWAQDDTATPAYNNYVATSSGNVIQATSASSLIEIKLYDSYVVWISGGDSAKHDDLPVYEHQYYVEGIGGVWEINEDYGMTVDSEDSNHYYLGPVSLTAETELKVYDVVNDSWLGSTSGYSEQPDYWTTTSEGNVKALVEGDYYIDLYVDHGEGNHLKLYIDTTPDDPEIDEFSAVIAIDKSVFNSWDKPVSSLSLYVWTADGTKPLGEWADCVGNLDSGSVTITSNKAVIHFIFFLTQEGATKQSMDLDCSLSASGNYILDVSSIGWINVGTEEEQNWKMNGITITEGSITPDPDDPDPTDFDLTKTTTINVIDQTGCGFTSYGVDIKLHIFDITFADGSPITTVAGLQSNNITFGSSVTYDTTNGVIDCLMAWVTNDGGVKYTATLPAYIESCKVCIYNSNDVYVHAVNVNTSSVDSDSYVLNSQREHTYSLYLFNNGSPSYNAWISGGNMNTPLSLVDDTNE